MGVERERRNGEIRGEIYEPRCVLGVNGRTSGYMIREEL